MSASAAAQVAPFLASHPSDNPHVRKFPPRTANDVFQRLTAGLAAGQWVTVCTPGNEPDPNVVGGHCYAVVSYDPSAGLFTVYNPWGISQQVSWDDLQNDFNWLSFSV